MAVFELRAGAVAALFAAVIGCGGGGSSSSAAPTPENPSGEPQARTFASGFAHPWSLAFLPDGSLLVTERGGRLWSVSADGKRAAASISGVPDVDARGQGGLFDVAVDPDFTSNRFVYLSYAEAGTGSDAGRNGTAVARAVLSADGRSLGGREVIFRQTPKVASTAHFGGRLVFAPDGTLFITLGERQLTSERGNAQDLSKGHGKVMRINRDGSIPRDNPFVDTPGAQASIWTYGHRNVQGAAINPATGDLWTDEHGPQGGDEVNLERKGKNYGWPKVSYGCEYGTPVGDCTPVGGASTGAGYVAPLTYWVPTSIAPSGMAFYTGDRLPQWKGSVFIGALAGEALWRLTIDGDKVTSRERLFADLNERIRDVRQGPDGWLYLLTDADSGRIIRIQR